MTTGQKVSISFFSTLLIFAVTILISQAGVFSQIEKKLFSQAKIQEKQEYLTEVSEACEEYISEIVNSICFDEKAYLQNSYIESYLKIDPSESETSNRRRITENLFNRYEGLVGIRLLDDKQNIWFSTFYDTDLSEDEQNRKEQNYFRYKNYDEVFKAEKTLNYDFLCDENSKELTPKFIMDSTRNQLVLCVQYQPGNMTKQFNAIKNGIFIFYFDIDSFENYLLESRVLNFGDRLIPVSTLKNIELYGFIVSQNFDAMQDIKNAVLHAWKTHVNSESHRYRMENLFEQRDGSVLVMLSVPYVQRYLRISGVYDSSAFTLSHEIGVLIYVCLFISILLIIFLLLSLKADYSIVIKNRIKRLQYEIISQYLNDRTDVDWSYIAKQLEIKKSIFSADIKKSFGKKGEIYSAQIDAVLDRSWTEIISVLKNLTNTSNESDLMKEIKMMLEEILNNSSVGNKTEILSVDYEVEDDDGNVVKTKDNSVVAEDVDIEKNLLSPKSTNTEVVTETYENEAMSQLIHDKSKSDSNSQYQEAEEIETIELVVDNAEYKSETSVKNQSNNQDVVNDVEVLDELEELEILEESENIESLDSVEIQKKDETSDFDEIDEIEEIEEISEETDVQENLADDVEEIDEAEEIVDAEEFDEIEEAEEVIISDDGYTAAANSKKAAKYVESNDTFISKDDELPTVENVFAEELCHGREYSDIIVQSTDSVDIVIFSPVFKTTKDEPLEDVEDISELSHTDCYSMVSFAEGRIVSPISGEKFESIVEKDGVFSIAQNIEFTDIIQDESFKSLVDSILK